MKNIPASGLLRFQIIAIMISFFAMGSIEMVGIASNYIKVSLHISDAKANLLPSLVYIWFLVCTIPTGILMNRIGRKKTVLISMTAMALTMLLPFWGTSYRHMVLCFILLGISNVCMQASLYPFLSNIISGKALAESLTTGQFVKTLSSFSAPYVAMIGAMYFTDFFDLGWRILFFFYFLVTLLAILLLVFSRIENINTPEPNTSFKACFGLLKNHFVLLSFIGVMCHVGIDISTNTVAPKLLMDRLGIVLDKASFGASLYFIARLVGCLSWTFFLNRISRKGFFYISILLILSALIGLYFAHTKEMIFICIAMIGIGNANLFPVLFSQAVLSRPADKSIISVLMIMGQAGGALFPISMGLAYDKIGINGSISVLMIGIIYLLYFATQLKSDQTGKIETK